MAILLISKIAVLFWVMKDRCQCQIDRAESNAESSDRIAGPEHERVIH